MLHHYIKIAFRNLLKYKLQSFICIVGLAIGFTSFALSSLWIRYELTYDTFRKDADRIYYVRMRRPLGRYSPKGCRRAAPRDADNPKHR